MQTQIVYIGVDVHPPVAEMAAKIIDSLRGSNESLVISIQSKKEMTGNVSQRTVVIERRQWVLSRLIQLFRLTTTLWSGTFTKATVWHFVGNGNKTLLIALALLATARQKRLVISPLGNCWLPTTFQGVYCVLPHRQMENQSLSAAGRSSVIMPASSLSLASERSSHTAQVKILFASVPPHREELAARGLDLVLESASILAKERKDCTFIIINRHAHLAADLEAYVKKFGAKNVRIENGYIENIANYLKSVSIVLIGSADGELPQVPLSVVEGLSQGVPCVIPKGLAVAEEILAYGAGETFLDPISLTQGINLILGNYEQYCKASLELSLKKFSHLEMIAKYSGIYEKFLGVDTR